MDRWIDGWMGKENRMTSNYLKNLSDQGNLAVGNGYIVNEAMFTQQKFVLTCSIRI